MTLSIVCGGLSNPCRSPNQSDSRIFAYSGTIEGMESGPKKQPEYVEGPEAFQRFDAMMTALVAVPRTVIEKREKAYRKKVEANPNRRGPKPKKNA